MLKLIIDVDTEKSAEYLKKEIEEKFPLLDGRIKIGYEAEIKPLDEIIQESKG